MDGSARILPIVFELFEVDSLLDVGCGSGVWLSVAADLGARRLTGIDTDWSADAADRSATFERPGFTFVGHDLRSPLPVDALDRHDLLLCLEVAQHLPESRAGAFVAELCACSTRVLFGAAIPLQYPPLDAIMINNRWQGYWAAHFREQDFVPCDVVRPLVWDDPAVVDYYAQNTLLYVHRSEVDAVRRAAAARLDAAGGLLDVVHPRAWERRSHEALDALGLRARVRVAMGIPSALVRAVRRRLDR